MDEAVWIVLGFFIPFPKRWAAWLAARFPSRRRGKHAVDVATRSADPDVEPRVPLT